MDRFATSGHPHNHPRLRHETTSSRRASTQQDRVSFATLRRLVEGQLSKQITEWETIRHDPNHLPQLIEFHAYHCTETLPHVDTGEAPTPQQLLSSPHFIAEKLRHFVHTSLFLIGEWSVVLKHFRELERIDEHLFPNTKREAIYKAKRFFDEILRSDLNEFHNAILRSCQEIRDISHREKNHVGYGGSVVTSAMDSVDLDGFLIERTLRGSIYRMLSVVHYDLDVYLAIADLKLYLSMASDTEKSFLKPPVLQQLYDMIEKFDIFNLLVTDDDEWKYTPPDEAEIAFFFSGKMAEEVFKTAIIDKHTSSLDALRNPFKMNKIWVEFDRIALKRFQTTIEKVCGFAEIVPSWIRRIQSPAEKHYREPEERHDTQTQPFLRVYGGRLFTQKEPEEVSSHEEGPSTQASRRKGKKRRGKRQLDVEPIPAKVEPYTYQFTPIEMNTITFDDLEEKPAKKKKVKRRAGVQTASVPSQPITVQEAQEEGPMYFVGVKVHATFCQLLVHANRMMPWTEFELAMAKLNFTKGNRYGSAVCYIPKDGVNSVFCCHRPHKSEADRMKIGHLGRQMKRQYGWHIGMFSPEEPRTMKPADRADILGAIGKLERLVI